MYKALDWMLAKKPIVFSATGSAEIEKLGALTHEFLIQRINNEGQLTILDTETNFLYYDLDVKYFVFD